ncbi:Cold shock domain-containing protein E1 [Merluccius polli]|uniref:Cold shock domain-containing protein E1 n=1 Tax=Merluccius polli TaxID=89951 RepID=A0AA47MDS4_MERPO|nr:Cold shock domain-containing protein E1 [Merluccius polli]
MMNRGPPRGHPDDGPAFGLPPPPGDWGPYGPPPEEWGPRGPPPPGDWGPRGYPPAEWGPHPGDWGPRPPGWGPPGWGPEGPDPWGPAGGPLPPPPPEWGPPPPGGWSPPPSGGWGPGGPPPELYYGPPGPVGYPPPDPYGPGPGPVPPGFAPPPPVEPPPPQAGFHSYPPPGWTAEMVNPPPEQPQWLKALISVPPSEPPPPVMDAAGATAAVALTTVAAAAAPAAPAKPAAAAEPERKATPLGLLGKRQFEKPPAGRSTGIISFIGVSLSSMNTTYPMIIHDDHIIESTAFIKAAPTFGYIEREDLEKFSFKFDAYFGNLKALTPGVRVHFTALKEKNNQVATDVKVAPGGTENVGIEIYEAVVSQPILEPKPGEKLYPGQVYATIGHLRTNLPFDRRDSTVTLLKNDQVLLNLLTDLVTDKRKATNIKPQIPHTYTHTKETRETGVITSIKGTGGVITSEKHGELPFDFKENLSDVDFTEEDAKEEVEFTVHTVRGTQRAIRIRRVKEPLLLTLCTSPPPQPPSPLNSLSAAARRSSASLAELGPNLQLDEELYEGIVSQTIIQPSANMVGYPGQISANIGPIKTNVTFDRQDCSVTLLKNDHVLINLLVDTKTRKRRAANIKPKVPFTFSYTQEKREKGQICSIEGNTGNIRSEEYEGLPFNVSETFSEPEFGPEDVGKEVEFTVTTVFTDVLKVYPGVFRTVLSVLCVEVKDASRAIRLCRMVPQGDKILEEQKKREEEERRKREERKKEAEEEKSKDFEKRKEVAEALAAAKDKWTPLGFKMTDPKTFDDISKDRFQGTVLKTISKTPQIYQISKDDSKREPEEKNHIKEEEKDCKEEADVDGDEKEVVKVKQEVGEDKQEVGADSAKVQVKQEQEDRPVSGQPAGGKEKDRPDRGRLVMTVAGEQKILHFDPHDVITSATMMVGDKVRFNIATQRESKEERATYVEILPDSFQESTEQRRHGIVIEFSEDTGLIKCSQNPQLFFRMSEVILVKHKKLQLNEKVEFSVVPHETADGGHQAIRITRFIENVFLPVRKLGAVGTGLPKGKMTINIAKETKSVEAKGKDKAETDKLKAVVKNLRSQDNKDSRGSGGRKDHTATRRRHGRSRSRSRSRSPSRTQYGRYIERRRSSSFQRERSHRRSRSRSRSRERSQDRRRESGGGSSSSSKRSKNSKEREGREGRGSGSGGVVVDDELARKKWELEKLNEIIAYRKSLVDRGPREGDPRGGDPRERDPRGVDPRGGDPRERDPRGVDPRGGDPRERDPRGVDPRGGDPDQRTCIDYDHGRITVPVKEYKPVQHREGSEYRYRSPSVDPERGYYGDPYERGYRPPPSGDPYRDRLYGDYPYGDGPYRDAPYADRPYGDRSYSEHPHSDQPYGERPFPERTYSSAPFTDRYDVYDDPYAVKPQTERPYDPIYDPPPAKRARSPDPHTARSATPTSQLAASQTSPATQPQPTFKPPQFRPQSPMDSPPRSPSPKPSTQRPSPAQPYNPLLEIFNKGLEASKKSPAPAPVRSIQPQQSKPSEPHSYKLPDDGLLPHERAVQDGSGFSRIVGLASEHPAPSRYRGVSPKSSSVERTNEEDQSSAQPYDKIQNLLRTIGMKLSTGEASNLGGPTPESLHSREFSSAERESGHSSAKMNWIGSTDFNRLHSPSPARAPSAEPLASRECEYEGFLDQQEMEALKRAKEMQSLTKTIGGVYEYASSSSTSAPNTPSLPPSTQFQPQHPGSSYSAPTNSWAPVVTTQSPTFPCMASTPPPSTALPARRYGLPPGPPTGSPPRYVQGFPTFGPSSSSSSSLPFLGQEDSTPNSTSPLQGLPSGTITQTPASSKASPLTPALTTSAEVEEPNSAITVARCLKVIETVKSLKPSKSVQFSLPTELPVSSVQIAGGTEEDIKAKQKEKLDQYNQRIQDKRELQYKEMRNLRKQGVHLKCKLKLRVLPYGSFGAVSFVQLLGTERVQKNKVGKPTGDPKSVWICGHSLVYWAESRAKSPEVGMQLGMDPSNVVIRWKGTQGMTWPQLLPLLHQLKVKWPNPDVLIMHLGGNDLSTESPTDLLASVKKDLSSMRSIFPKCLLVWSNILPRRVWRHSADNHEVDLVRTTVNRRIHNIILDLGGTSLTHDNIRCGSNTGQYRADGVHLSSKGIDTFNLNLQDFLEKWEMDFIKDADKP